MNLSPIVSKTIPEFVNDDYPLFVQFLKTYYKWLDNTQINSIENVVDIDNTLDSFIQYFRQELDIFGIKYQHIDEKLYLKNVKQFYLAKGSEAAYWFLFKILFNTESAIIRPWDYVFIPSIANWVQDITVFIKIYTGDANKFKQTNLIIIGDDNVEYPIKIKDVVQIRPNIFELYLFTPITGNISVGNNVKSVDKSVTGRIVPTVVNISIQYPGRNFNVGEIYNLDTTTGYGSKLIITEVDENGGIKKANLISFGLGYEAEFMQVLSPVSILEKEELEYNFKIIKDFVELSPTTFSSVNPNSISEILVDAISDYIANEYFGGELYTTGVRHEITNNLDLTISELLQIYRHLPLTTLSFNSGDRVNNIVDTGIISRHNYGLTPTEYFTDLSYVGDVIRQFEDKIQTEETKYNSAILFCYVGHTAKYQGYYLNNYSILGQNNYIQDSYYYQIYSYVTSLDKPLKTYKTILENNIHPIGNKLFGLYSPDNYVISDTDINLDIDFIVPHNYFERIIPSESIILNRINYYSDSIITSDHHYYLINGELRLTPDNITVDDSIVLERIINISDTVANITEEFNYLISQNGSDDVVISDSYTASNSMNRSLSDIITVGDSVAYVMSINVNLQENIAVSEINGLPDKDIWYTRDYLVSDYAVVSDVYYTEREIQIEDSINITDTGIIYPNTYVDSDIQYWEPLYTDTEQPF